MDRVAEDQALMQMIEEGVKMPEEEAEEGEVQEDEEEVEPAREEVEVEVRKRRRAVAEEAEEGGKKRKKAAKAPARPYASKGEMAKAIARLHRGREELKRQRKAVTEAAKELDEIENRVCATLFEFKMKSVRVNDTEFSIVAKLKEMK